jgi:hypothetical protein
MRPFRLSLWCCGLLLAGASQAQAAWDNVFQVACFGCKKPVATANYYAPPPPPCAQPCPQPCQPTCTTQYQLRSYYQPVTTYRTSYYYEPVTSYRTSYYYEPVTSYRYSSYYDPSTCSYQTRACPTTSYQLKAQSCPVTSYLQRCQTVPETSYKQSYYYEPVTTCCQTSVGSPIYPNAPGYPNTPGVSEGRMSAPVPAPPGPGPGVSEGRDRLPMGGEQSRKIGIPDPQPRFLPSIPDSNNPYRQPALQPPVPVQQSAPKQTQPPPTVRLDRIVLAEEPNVEGQVVVNDKNPQAGARVLFVSADQLGAKQTVTADSQGQFKVSLASGGWLVYIHDEKGNPIFKEKVEVKENQPQRMILTSR